MDFGIPTLIELDNLSQCAELCLELGLAFIEINMNLPQYQTALLEDEIKKAAKSGLYFTIHIDETNDIWQFNDLAAEAYLKTIIDVLELSKKLNIPSVNMHLLDGIYFTLPDRRLYLYEKYIDKYISRTVIFRGQAERILDGTDIRLLIENTSGFKGFHKMAIDELLHSKYFGLTLDVGHDHILENSGLDKEFIMGTNRFSHMHLHDSAKKSTHLALGDGETNIADALNLANNHSCRVVLETKTAIGIEKSCNYLKEYFPNLFFRRKEGM